MTKQIFLVQTNPVEGREDEFNDWYSNQHLSDVLNVPGFVAAQRFRLSDTQRPGTGAYPYKYIAIYEMEGDVDAILNKIQEGVAAGKILMSDCLDMSSWRLSFWNPRGPRATA